MLRAGPPISSKQGEAVCEKKKQSTGGGCGMCVCVCANFDVVRAEIPFLVFLISVIFILPAHVEMERSSCSKRSTRIVSILSFGV